MNDAHRPLIGMTDQRQIRTMFRDGRSRHLHGDHRPSCLTISLQ